MKRLALPRQKAVDFTKRAEGVLKASMKLVQQRWTESERRKPVTTSIHIYEIWPGADKQGFESNQRCAPTESSVVSRAKRNQ
jgi:hypothetical protein